MLGLICLERHQLITFYRFLDNENRLSTISKYITRFMTFRFSLSICFGVVLLSLSSAIMNSSTADARCPNGYHKSQSGDCEEVTHSGGLPRCPDGFHRSPDGDCERVSSGNNDNSGSSDSEDDELVEDENDNEGRTEEENDNGSQSNEKTSLSNSPTPLSKSTECKGSADCFKGIVTKVVDGDTLDVNNVRVRLAIVNTISSLVLPKVQQSRYGNMNSSRFILNLYDYHEFIISAFIVRLSNRPCVPVFIK